MMHLAIDHPTRADVRALLDEHLHDMHATSAPESVHALDHSSLAAPGVTLWSAREDGTLLGIGALKDLGGRHGEIKSMRTATLSRGRGVAAAMLHHLLTEATARGWDRVSLETGTQDYFAPARRLYARHGFVECSPFGDYVLDPSSVFMSRRLDLSGPAPTDPAPG
ncbi:GCN5 family acetyltransferase [Aeromicrobium sp. Root495]|nr:GCN5 family acetyltransferase [Aeromicrobium sp. Root495]